MTAWHKYMYVPWLHLYFEVHNDLLSFQSSHQCTYNVCVIEHRWIQVIMWYVLTLGPCVKVYSSWFVCVSGPNNLPRLLSPARDSAYRRKFNVWILVKTYGLQEIPFRTPLWRQSGRAGRHGAYQQLALT